MRTVEASDAWDQLVALAGPAAPLLEAAGAVPPSRVLQEGATLRRSWAPQLVAAAFTLAELRRQASAKMSGPEQLWLTREGLEQASSTATARHRAGRLAATLPATALVADLGCGIGGDTMALAAAGVAAILAVDRDPRHAWCATKNARTAGGRADGVASDVRSLSRSALARRAHAAVLDPARRRGDTRTRATDTEPSLAWATGLADDIPAVVVKAAPGLPREAVPRGWAAEYVSVRGSLKECVLWSAPLAQGEAPTAVLLSGPPERAALPEETHVLRHVVTGAPVGPPGGWLLDPDPAIGRAGAVPDLAAAVDGWQIDPRIAFLCTERPTYTPFARTYEVAASMPFHERRLREVLRSLDVGTVDIRRRGLAGDVDSLRRRLRLRGSRRALLAMTRRDDTPWAIVGFRATG